jgi:hypothetical protein
MLGGAVGKRTTMKWVVIFVIVVAVVVYLRSKA